jgi:hypothetical protein
MGRQRHRPNQVGTEQWAAAAPVAIDLRQRQRALLLLPIQRDKTAEVEERDCR